MNNEHDGQPARTGTGQVLLVEDEPADALLIQRALARAGLTSPVRLIEDGEGALDYLLGNAPYQDRELYPLPALILLDLKLPRLGGIELLRQLKRMQPMGRIPVIVLTSSAQTEDVERAYELGANSYLVKPARFAEFCDVASQLVGYWLLVNRQPPLDS